MVLLVRQIATSAIVLFVLSKFKGIRQGGVTFDGQGDAIHLKNSPDINMNQHDEQRLSLWFKADELLASGTKKTSDL